MNHLHALDSNRSPYPLEDLLHRAGNWFQLKGRKQAFWGALIAGLCCHFYMLTNMLPNHDWQHNFYTPQRWPSYGRWALEYACAPSSNAILPWVNGLLSLLYIALAAMFVAELLGLDRPLFAALAGACMAVFPAVASTFTYIYTADGYMLSLLLAVLAVRCCLYWRRWCWGCLPAALLLGTSMGIYQSFGSVTLLLFCMILALALLRNMPSLKQLLADVLRMGLTAAGGFAFYYVMMRWALASSGQRLSLYQGIDCLNNEVQLCLSGLIYQFHLVSNARHFGLDFLSRELPAIGGGVWGTGLVWAMYLLLGLLYLAAFIVKKQWKKWYAPLVHLAVILVFPLGINYVQVISPELNYHLVMHYSAVLVFLAVLCLAQLLCESEEAAVLLRRLANTVPPLVCTALLFYWTVATNVGYTNMQYQYEKSYGSMVRLADRIEQCDGYYPGVPVWFSDAHWPGISQSSVGNQEGFSGMTGIRQFDPLHYRNFMHQLLGVDLSLASYHDIEHILTMPEFEQMPIWPASGSVQMIDGIIIIKTSTQPG